MNDYLCLDGQPGDNAYGPNPKGRRCFVKACHVPPQTEAKRLLRGFVIGGSVMLALWCGWLFLVLKKGLPIRLLSYVSIAIALGLLVMGVGCYVMRIALMEPCQQTEFQRRIVAVGRKWQICEKKLEGNRKFALLLIVLIVILLPFFIEVIGEAMNWYRFPATAWVKGRLWL